MSEDNLPEEARRLPTLNIGGDIDFKDLYKRVEGTECRRCKGSGVDPDGEYPCLLCRGKKIEYFPGRDSYLVCNKHPEQKLIAVGKRHTTWEDGQGFDHEGYVEVKGCPICKVPVLSRLSGQPYEPAT